MMAWSVRASDSSASVASRAILVGTMDRWNNAKRAEERDRVKECGDEGTYPYWLRSVSATGSTGFRLVFTDGSGSGYGAHCSHGFAPGFDI